MSGPLTGIRIVDLTTMISGPFATMLLGDQGADVIKIERVDGGDQMRRFGRRSGTLTAPFVNNNRSKRSVAVDLKRGEGVGSGQADRVHRGRVRSELQARGGGQAGARRGRRSRAEPETRLCLDFGIRRQGTVGPQAGLRSDLPGGLGTGLGPGRVRFGPASNGARDASRQDCRTERRAGRRRRTLRTREDRTGAAHQALDAGRGPELPVVRGDGRSHLSSRTRCRGRRSSPPSTSSSRPATATSAWRR